MDDNNELIIYILQQLRYGVSEESIRTTLVQNGWPQALIDRAFSMVQQAAPHNVPPTDYSAQTQPNYGTPIAADLPAPAENPFAAVEEHQQEEQKAKRGRALKTLLITVAILVLLAAASFAGYLIYKAIKDHSSKTPKTTTSQSVSKADQDKQRKKDIDALAAKLMAYYSAQKTYPTLASINDDSFASTKNGFDASKYKDPSWTKKSQCVDNQGKPALADGRTESCYSYRATAMNGGDCDGDGVKCTRAVLTADLSNNKPYIVALDQNVKE